MIQTKPYFELFEDSNLVNSLRYCVVIKQRQ